ncbi:hypothetical protein Pmar_PMAR000650 [Perkinsus marinus ATCC 50983]|uniref:Uncharacterized protein n=1 Tax=Perkinsus marinus (strain ATCC 50983 / TXsc) TaxID=423536 RepID=C5KRE4_PERM5|nr:hypothetical protein Pmar_PMAR000650 [Perkinsus marinus ATCC 50983]EER12917.1 hypothetical protein Pmar_PMAR000650 [Perkinsus marinus ATCC 50983]|eukprot:XP_002781122.1 hypothetical protein Pmar_PMAR000650 [Perkinsus marinus ATCC 50983]
MLVAGSPPAEEKVAFPPQSTSLDAASNSGGKTATSAPFQPLPTTTPVPFPSHIQLEGATGPHADEINGCYVLKASASKALEKWKFCYFKHKCDDVVMCYGEGLPELGPNEGAVGWVVGKLSDSIDILARCVLGKERNSANGFKWELKTMSNTFTPTYTMSVKPVVATAAAAAAAVCSQEEPSGGGGGLSRRNRERAGSAAAHQRIAFASMLASAQAQLLAAQSGDGLLPAPAGPISDNTDDSSFLPAELSRSSTALGSDRRISFAATTTDNTKHSTTLSSRRMSADAPVFIPRRHTVQGETPFAPALTTTATARQMNITKRGSVSAIDDLFKNAERQQGVFVNTRARRVTWKLGAVSEKLKSVIPGEGVPSITFRLPRNNGEPGPPIQLEFYPFGVKGKSPPGCVAVGLVCPQGACMRFTVSLGKVNSGKKVLMGNKFHVDFYPSTGRNSDGGTGDSGIVQAFKYSEISVTLQLIDWMDEPY